MSNPKYPDIVVRLVGEDVNAFFILGKCSRAMKRNGIFDKYEEFKTEAISGDYDHLLRTVMAWFTLE
jgi:hypothetical protein